MITDKLIAGSEKDESIYCLLINSFRDIENKKEITLVADHFEKEILKILGYGEQKNPIDFIQSLLNEKIERSAFL